MGAFSDRIGVIGRVPGRADAPVYPIAGLEIHNKIGRAHGFASSAEVLSR